MLRPTLIKQTVEQGVKKILSEEEKFFYGNQNRLAWSQIRVNEEKENFYKTQTKYTKFKQFSLGMLISTAAFIELGHLALQTKDINGLSVYGPITATLLLPYTIQSHLFYKNMDIKIKNRLEQKKPEQIIEEQKKLNTESKK